MFPQPRKRSPASFLFAAFSAMLFLGVGSGCVSNELYSMDAARDAYEECEIRLSPSHPDCKALRQTYLDAQRRYEENARRAWNCDPRNEECPTPR